MKRIVWLASYPKSGNTWLRTFLVNYIENRTEPADINDLRFTIASAPHIFSGFAGIDAADLSHDEVDELRPDVYLQYAASEAGLEKNGLKFFKVHDAFTCLPDGRPLFPVEATYGIIYIVRNPLDVAVSLSHHNGIALDKAISLLAKDSHTLAGGTDAGQSQLRQKVMAWGTHIDSWNNLPNVPRLLIRYEDMVSDGITVFGAVVRFLGFEDDPDRLRRSVAFSSFDALRAQEEASGFRENPNVVNGSFFRKGQVGSWRDELSHEQVIRITSAHHIPMRRYGYLDDGGKLLF